MLPDTNGYEIVRQLRQEEKVSDTPVIMLTALDDENHQIKGYKVGADDYMVKPCNFHLLIARMIQLITWHEKRKAEQPAQVVPQEEKSVQDLSVLHAGGSVEPCRQTVPPASRSHRIAAPR